MSCSRVFILLTVLISQVCMSPQFISFKDGKLGVNFAGFHAGIGIGGSLDNSGTTGGLFAEAGTPFGQSAKAGLGGAVDENGNVSGRLFADASGGDKVKASAGLAGNVNGEKTSGGGFATAQAGDRLAFTRMNGERVVSSAGDFQQLKVQPDQEKGVTNIESTNEVNPMVYVEQQPQEKHDIVHTYNKPRRHNFRKTAFLGGHIGPGGEIIPPTVESKQVSQRRIDVDAEATVSSETNVNDDVGHTSTTIVTHQKSPTFFSDIFNIPISALKAVGSLLSNTATNTNISVQKSATVETGVVL